MIYSRNKVGRFVKTTKSNAQYILQILSKSITTANNCIIWQGTTNNKGYGTTSYRGSLVLVHRLMYTLKCGNIKKGLCICHTCDTPNCVNHKHLFAGSILENSRDRTKKGRSFGKLNPTLAKEIRSIYKLSQISQRQLAKEYKVTQRSIWQIVNNRVYIENEGNLK